MITKCWKNYKTFKKKNIKDFSNSKFMQIVSLVGIKKCRDKGTSGYNINSSRATNHTHQPSDLTLRFLA